jgi:poly(hydroxyalkanoate) depolymerase family esterase
MKAFSDIAMREVTRLTRAGKLAEAVRLLQGRAPDAEEGLVPAKRVFSNLTRTLFAPVREESVDAPTAAPNARFETRAFTNAAGTRTYKVYRPSGHVGEKLPVVVMLHGCTQDPDDFAAGTRMNEVAEEQGFLVVYPCQPKSANMNRCWNWFNASEQRRGGGEPSLITGIARDVVASYSGDPTRIYVAGLSAGGAAAANLAATYPDVFAAVGVHSGLACGAARDMSSAFAAMGGGGAVVPRREGPLVPTIVFHGDADRTVNVVNAQQVIAQVAPETRSAPTTTEGRTPAGMSYTRTVYADAAGAPTLERWTLHGAGHAWSGGSAEGSFTDPRGPDASREMARFFLAHRRG